jgi:ATP-dependent DNA helicase RecG
MDPNLPIQHLPGIGKQHTSKLHKLGINTLYDIIHHYPFRYDDFSKIHKIEEAIQGEVITIQGVVWQIKNVRTRTGKFLTNAQISDDSGILDVIWFNQPYLTKNIKPGSPISLSGKIDKEGPRPKLISPTYEILKSSMLQQANDQTTHTGRLVSIYPETEGITSKWLRSIIKTFLPIFKNTTEDYLPLNIIQNQKLMPVGEALQNIHFPKNFDEVKEARKRLAFDELFLTQLLSQIRRTQWHKTRNAPQIKTNNVTLSKFKNALPFKLTDAQNKAVSELLNDLSGKVPTNRLLEGDVGSGKTVVAAIGCLMAFSNNLDSLIAAPTEILTFQHYKSLTEMLKPFGIKVGIWTSSKKEAGDVVCGTHALLSSFETKKQVGFVVVDEQHRFGVAQRAQLFMTHSKNLTPHLLTMTATPIPRTLALTLYGDLDLSILNEMPVGRQKIATFVVPNNKRVACYKFIEKEIAKKHQAFIVTPFVEPSETMTSVKSATTEFEKLKNIFPKEIKLGLLHGRLKSKDKEQIINNFKSGKIDILVATPVVEVGIDVAGATIIVIESAERFGLAQLHQLRGRVGRSNKKSYCFLFTDSKDERSQKRLKSMEKIYVGFELAEIDLKMRGSGQLFGLKQSGFESFKIADLSDILLVSAAQKEAKDLIKIDADLKSHPQILEKINTLSDQLSEPN